MKVIYNKLIPFKGFFAINLFGIMFVRDEYKDTPIKQKTFTHESIHSEQMLDFVGGVNWLLPVGGCIFYILYFIEWLVKLGLSVFKKIDPYLSISFEQEAYYNQYRPAYPTNRKRFSWISYIFETINK